MPADIFHTSAPFPLRAGTAVLLAALSSGAFAQAASAGNAQPEASTLRPITVTASKREQSLASINGAVTVIEQPDLDDAQVASTFDLARVLPGVQMSSSGSLLYSVIGVRGITSAQDFYNPALTVYVDGIPQLPVFASQPLIGVERVELLKGPQATLYGKSAQGGVLNIVTRQPDNETRFNVLGGVSSRGGHQLQGEVAGPLVKDMLYASVSLAKSDAPGDLHNPATGADDQGGFRSETGTVKLRLAPAGAPWQAGLSVGRDCTRATQDSYVPFDDPGSRQTYIMAGMPAQFADPYMRRCTDSQALTGSYDLGDWRLTAMAARQTVDIERRFALGPYFSQQPEDWRQDVQELRLATKAPGRSWDGVFGLYRQSTDQTRTYINDLKTPMTANALTTRSHNESQSYAIYGDVTWHATSALDLSAGLRASRDKAKTVFAGSALDFNTFQPAGFSGASQTEGDRVLGRLSAGYRLDSQWRAYANLSQGYKPGGFNLAPSSAADSAAYQPETAISYEAGARYTSGALRGSFALYRIDVKDVQLYRGDAAAGTQTLRNAGDSRSNGAEFDLEWDVNPVWTLGLAGFVNDASFRRYDDPALCANCQGNDVPFAPSHGLSFSVKGSVPTRLGMMRPRLTVRSTGAQYFDTANTLRQGAYTVADASLAWRVQPNVELTVYAHNLTDRQYRTYGFAGGPMGNFAQRATGRTLGMTVSYAY
ncbi:TonB-dependent siderophore receptor [Pigmentiphaga aceris]|uniref:TonB-dependent siderophore receptor n=1 Tax=Pigmentiphaga aceris TaxID=1940612 RepID=A0A5C0AUL0_9BURK|nr:TonB-dependent siderophore receptor [Pigmentiphaga aceris]QEI04993.1 TonB-dependent siderophore receptor [Pigmentiphaga aceris]